MAMALVNKELVIASSKGVLDPPSCGSTRVSTLCRMSLETGKFGETRQFTRPGGMNDGYSSSASTKAPCIHYVT